MKKEYKKPEIFVEQFSLIENISMAGVCDEDCQTHEHYYHSCSYNDPDSGTNIFVTPKVCKKLLVEGEDGGLEHDCINGFGYAFSS